MGGLGENDKIHINLAILSHLTSSLNTGHWTLNSKHKIKAEPQTKDSAQIIVLLKRFSGQQQLSQPNYFFFLNAHQVASVQPPVLACG